jgi:carbamoyl-phosphate synthase large subunit
MVLAMGLPFGLTHAEYKYRDGKYYLIEIAARGGGTRISSDIAPYVSDIDSNGLLISMALGEQAELPVSMGTDRFAILKFPDFRTGMVERILQLDEASAIPGILCFGLNFRESEEILPMSDDRSRPGYYIAGASSMEELGALCVQFENTLKIIYKEGSYAN